MSVDHPLLARFAWHDLPSDLYPVAAMYGVCAVALVEADPSADLRPLLDERNAAVRAAEQQAGG